MNPGYGAPQPWVTMTLAPGMSCKAFNEWEPGRAPPALFGRPPVARDLRDVRTLGRITMAGLVGRKARFQPAALGDLCSGPPLALKQKSSYTHRLRTSKHP